MCTGNILISIVSAFTCGGFCLVLIIHILKERKIEKEQEKSPERIIEKLEKLLIDAQKLVKESQSIKEAIDKTSPSKSYGTEKTRQL